MNLHRNARTCPGSRLLIAERRRPGWPLSAIAPAHGRSEKTVRKWSRRYEDEGAAGLVDRFGAVRPSSERVDPPHEDLTQSS